MEDVAGSPDVASCPELAEPLPLPEGEPGYGVVRYLDVRSDTPLCSCEEQT
jgi:hypothetical protein